MFKKKKKKPLITNLIAILASPRSGILNKSVWNFLIKLVR